jgi:hypothetical protein
MMTGNSQATKAIPEIGYMGQRPCGTMPEEMVPFYFWFAPMPQLRLEGGMFAQTKVPEGAALPEPAPADFPLERSGREREIAIRAFGPVFGVVGSRDCAGSTQLVGIYKLVKFQHPRTQTHQDMVL